MGTTCQLGDARSLGLAADAPWEDVLNAILLDANRHRAAGGRVGPDSYEAARGMVPPQLPIEYIRAVNGRFGICTRVGVGDDARGGLAMVPVSFARTFGAGADPTDPWSALVMVVALMRRIASIRLAAYGQMWRDALAASGATDAGRRMANHFAGWYEDHAAWEMTNMAREAGYRSMLQYAGWRTTPDQGAILGGITLPAMHVGGMPPADEWPIALADDLDFWGLVLMEMFAESEYPGRGSVLADKLWKGILNEGNDGLWGYYSVGGEPGPAAASMAHDGIAWVRPLVGYAQELLTGYSSLPAGQRRAMGLSGTDIEKLNGTLAKVPVILARVPEWQASVSVGPYDVGGERLGWSQVGVVPVENSTGVPIETLYDTLSLLDESVMRWAGYQMIPPLPTPPTPPSPPPVEPEPETPETRRTSPIIPLAFGLALPLLGYWVWSKWRMPT